MAIEQPTPVDAHQAYVWQQSCAQANVARITAAMKDHATRHGDDMKNWALVGDLAFVNDCLARAAAIIGAPTIIANGTNGNTPISITVTGPIHGSSGGSNVR
jgi:hypothetical protein